MCFFDKIVNNMEFSFNRNIINDLLICGLSIATNDNSRLDPKYNQIVNKLLGANMQVNGQSIRIQITSKKFSKFETNFWSSKIGHLFLTNLVIWIQSELNQWGPPVYNEKNSILLRKAFPLRNVNDKYYTLLFDSEHGVNIETFNAGSYNTVVYNNIMRLSAIHTKHFYTFKQALDFCVICQKSGPLIVCFRCFISFHYECIAKLLQAYNDNSINYKQLESYMCIGTYSDNDYTNCIFEGDIFCHCKSLHISLGSGIPKIVFKYINWKCLKMALITAKLNNEVINNSNKNNHIHDPNCGKQVLYGTNCPWCWRKPMKV